MGAVWRANDERLNRIVALKQLVLPPTLSVADRHEATERIMREGRLAARLQHPHAISVFDVTDHDGTPWLVMEYQPARSLAAVLADRGRLAPQVVAEIGRQLASALAAAHAAGIVHRDVKPGNVLLGEAPDGQPVAKLTDFGISRATDDVTVTRTGVLSGTPAYLAPEVARGAQPKPAADVFALGATLYTAVEGHTPFGEAENSLALLHVVAHGQVIPPRQAGPLTATLMQLLRNAPHERPTMPQAEAALARVADGGHHLPHQPLPAGPGQPVPPAVAPHTRVDLPATATTGRHASPGGQWLGRYERRPALLVAAGVGLTVLAVIFALAATSGEDDPVAGQSTKPITVPTIAITSTTIPPTTTTTRTVTPDELQQAVAEYYQLLPKDIEKAWNRLSPSAQDLGYEKYEEIWSRVEAVQATPTGVDAATMTVRVMLVYRIEDARRPQAEIRELTLIPTDSGALLIEQDRRISDAQAPTSTRKRRG